MSRVFQNIDPPPPSPPGEYVLCAFVVGGGHTRRVERSIFWKTQDTALYSTYTGIESSLLQPMRNEKDGDEDWYNNIKHKFQHVFFVDSI
jgi:hypothetical protein